MRLSLAWFIALACSPGATASPVVEVTNRQNACSLLNWHESAVTYIRLGIHESGTSAEIDVGDGKLASLDNYVGGHVLRGSVVDGFIEAKLAGNRINRSDACTFTVDVAASVDADGAGSIVYSTNATSAASCPMFPGCQNVQDVRPVKQ